MTITKEQVAAMVKTAKEYDIQPFVVQTEAQAEEMTAADPLGHVWRVGEEFYDIHLSSKIP